MVEVLADHARGWALALDLGDDMGRIRMPPIDARLEEVARPSELGDALLQHLDRHRLAGTLDLG